MDEGTVDVEFGGVTVAVPEGGYYDRFRMNPDLDEVAQDPAAGNVDFFRRFPKHQADSPAGVIWSPNFFYRMKSVQLLFLAPVARLRAALPAPLAPLRVSPLHGLVALTFFSYEVCDNDPYREVAIAVVIRRPWGRGPHLWELVQSIRHRAYVAHLLALPVTTEIARVRGVHGYHLPKWRAGIDLTLDGQVRAIISALGGKPDLTLSAPLPAFAEVPSQSRLGSNTMIHPVDGVWSRSVAQTNTLTFAQRLFPRDVTLSRLGGPMTDLLGGLGAGTILRLDVVRDAQLVLNMPVPLASLAPFLR